MFGKFLILALAVLALAACAKPNYLSPQTQELADVAESPKACSQQLVSQQRCYSLVWQNVPQESQAASFVLNFYSLFDSGLPLDPLDTLTVTLWMPSMGHGSSPVRLKKISDGVFLVDRVFFIMPGEWEILIRFKKGEELIEQVVQKITI